MDTTELKKYEDVILLKSDGMYTKSGNLIARRSTKHSEHAAALIERWDKIFDDLIFQEAK